MSTSSRHWRLLPGTAEAPGPPHNVAAPGAEVRNFRETTIGGQEVREMRQLPYDFIFKT